jgi:hypothetical protein
MGNGLSSKTTAAEVFRVPKILPSFARPGRARAPVPTSARIARAPVSTRAARRITLQEEAGVNVNSNGLAIVDRSGSRNETVDRGNDASQDDQSFQYPRWQKVCQEALTELQPDKLKERIAVAEAAVVARLQELANGTDAPVERQALLDVTSSLRFLKRDTLRFPDWESSR